MSSIPTDGTGSISQSDAINLLLEQETPEETQASEDQATELNNQEEIVETESEEINDEAVENDQAESEIQSEDEIEETYFSVKVDGEEFDVNESELIKGYQLEKTAQKRLQDLAEQKKIVQADKVAIEQERSKYAQVLQQLQANLSTEKNSQQKTEAEWKNLYDNNPLEYVRQKDLIRENQTRLEAIQAEQATLQQQNLVAQNAKLLEYIPEWKNVETATKEKNELSSYLKTNGFSEADIAGASDARIINLARKAQLYDNLKSKKSVIKKKVGAAPKMIKSGVPKGKVDVVTQQKKEAYSKLIKSGSKSAAVDYLLQRNR